MFPNYLFIFAGTVAFTLTKAHNRTKIICDEPNVRESFDKFFDCFSRDVRHSIDKNDSACETFRRDLHDFQRVVDRACNHVEYKSFMDERDDIEFIKFAQFSIRNGGFADFVKNDGVACIEAVRDQISACVKKHDITLEKPNITYTKYNNLWQMTGLYINERSCQATEKLKECTQKAMRDEGYYKCHYDNYNVLYVGSLFDFILERCTRLLPNWKEQSCMASKHEQSNGNISTTHVLLGVLIAVALVSLVYLCIRDYRGLKGHWRTLQERVSIIMMNRRRPL